VILPRLTPSLWSCISCDLEQDHANCKLVSYAHVRIDVIIFIPASHILTPDIHRVRKEVVIKSNIRTPCPRNSQSRYFPPKSQPVTRSCHFSPIPEFFSSTILHTSGCPSSIVAFSIAASNSSSFLTADESRLCRACVPNAAVRRRSRCSRPASERAGASLSKKSCSTAAPRGLRSFWRVRCSAISFKAKFSVADLVAPDF
jgi:hypothetical protein